MTTYKSCRLFNVPANRSRTQTFECEKFAQPVTGTVYPRASFRWPGVPLGGLGTGYVSWDPTGRFSHCTLYNQLNSGIPAVNTIPFQLTAKGQTWGLAMRGDDGKGDLVDLRYFGHFPMVDVQCDVDGPVQVEIRAFAPFLPGDAVESNTPAIVFVARMVNTSGEPVEADLAFAAPPPPQPITGWTPFSEGQWHGATALHAPDKATPKLGFQSMPHEVALAVQGGQVTVKDGTLTGSFRATLAPGASAETRFILTWHQPYVRDSWNRAERLMYADRFADAVATARYAIAHHAAWLSRITGWQGAVYAHKELPPALREALVNSFYAITKNSHWITRSRPDDWFPAQGLFVMNESFTTCSVTETLPCHYLGNFPVLFFFPELERTTLEAYRHYQLTTGEVPFGFDRGFGVRNPAYQVQHSNGIGEYIEILYRYWCRTGDEEFLREFYPSAREAMRYLEFLDTDNDGLVNEHAHSLPGEFWPANVPWDNWPQPGTSCYTGMKSLTACAALTAMADHAGDTETASRCRARLARGRKRYEDLFWNGRYYSLSVSSVGVKDDTCLSALAAGAWGAAVLGLESPVDAARVRASLKEILRLCGDQSPYGLVLASDPEGGPILSNQRLDCDFPRDVWPSFNFEVAAICHYTKAEPEKGLSAAMQVVDALFHGAHAMPWGWPCNLNGHDGSAGHGHDYTDPQTLWTIPLAMAGQDIRQAGSSAGLVQDILQGARKSVAN